MTFCLGVAEAKLANNMVNQLAWDPNLQPSERRRMLRRMIDGLPQSSRKGP